MTDRLWIINNEIVSKKYSKYFKTITKISVRSKAALDVVKKHLTLYVTEVVSFRESSLILSISPPIQTA